MSLGTILFGERSLTKVAMLFADEAAARAGARTLVEQGAVPSGAVRVVGPDAARERGRGFSKAIQPETTGIAVTIVRAHLVLGAVGLVIGLAL